ncbi:hypothetical protein A2U01_0070929, partial [Trifolium medium]|nr:hypothetical protein [Trifolium medium]
MVFLTFLNLGLPGAHETTCRGDSKTREVGTTMLTIVNGFKGVAKR